MVVEVGEEVVELFLLVEVDAGEPVNVIAVGPCDRRIRVTCESLARCV